MKKLLFSLSLILTSSVFAEEEPRSYMSVALQPSKFSKESYFSEMEDIVQIEDGQAIAIEASPGRVKGVDIDLGAFINTKNDEDKLEGLFASFSFGGWFTRVERGSSSGSFKQDGFDEYTRPVNNSFENEYTYLVLAKYINNSISFGFGYYQQTMPGYFYLTYESLPSGSQPDKIIDPASKLKIIGGMFQVDAIKSLMRGQDSPWAKFFINTPSSKLYFAYGTEMLTGIGLTSAGDTVEDELKDEYNVTVEEGMDTKAGWGLLIQISLELGYYHRGDGWDAAAIVGYNYRQLGSMYLGSSNFEDPEGGPNAANAENGAGDFTIIHGPFFRGVVNF